MSSKKAALDTTPPPVFEYRDTDKDIGEIKKDFQKWVKTPPSGYGMYEPFSPSVLISLYMYTPPKPRTKIYTSFNDDGSGAQRLKSRVYPFAKVLAVPRKLPAEYEGLNRGDIVLIQENLIGVEQNPEWEKYQMLIREQPSLQRELPSPPRYIPRIARWENYVFKKDKFRPDLDTDAYTFLIPVNMLRCKVV